MSDGSRVTAAEIARLANVGRAAVSNWRRRHPDFPEPVLAPGGTPTFRLEEVEHWLRSQGKLAGATQLDAVWRALEGESNLLERVADVATYLRGNQAVALPKRLRSIVDDLTDLPRDEVVESLCARAFDRQQRQHLVTPVGLARIMVELAAPVEGTLLDPACGAGTILRAAAEAGAKRLAGQEVDPPLAQLTAARLAPGVPADIVTGDSLRADAFPGLRADTVVCDPPYGYRDWGHEELGIDPRWEYGFPVKGEPELAWLQHCLAHVRPGGTVVMALPAGVAFRRSGRAIRQALLRRGAIRAVVALPAGVLMSTGISIHLWILRNPGTESAGGVLLVDTSRHQPPRRGQVDWTALERDILGAWREFSDTGTVEDVPGRQRVVQPIDLLGEEVDLSPARHLPKPRAELDLAALDEVRNRLTTLGKLAELLPPVREGARDARAVTTIGDLARAGALTLRQQVGPLDMAEGGTGPRVLTGREVATGQEPAERLTRNGQDEPILLVPGDLVVPLLVAGDGVPRTRIIADDGLVLGPNLQLIRVDESKLDVHFLAGQIRGGDARTSGTTASGVHRLDVRRAEIPVLDLDRQRLLGEAFRRLEEFSTGLRDAAESATDLARQLTGGLAGGTVEPAE